MTLSLLFIGPLNTDIVATGLKQLPTSGTYEYARELSFSAGGKACNMAQMSAHLLPADSVAMLGRTTRDQYGFWKLPIEALQEAGVSTDAVVIDTASTKLPGMTLIAVDEKGNNQIIALPGVSNDLSNQDVENAQPLFSEIAKNSGFVGLTLECPLAIAAHAAEKAKAQGIRVVFDPGGIQEGTDISMLLNDAFLVKPNEHEASIITGVTVEDLASAHQAATILMHRGAANVLITAGANGAYLFTKDTQKHIQIPSIHSNGPRDETGCGDQVMATICAALLAGDSIEEAAEAAVVAGTLQFHKAGVRPLTKDELQKAGIHEGRP